VCTTWYICLPTMSFGEKVRLWAQEREEGGRAGEGVRVNVVVLGCAGMTLSAQTHGNSPMYRSFSSFPFHCWTMEKRLFVGGEMRKEAHIQGVDPWHRQHPFHCWSLGMCHFPEPLSQPESRNLNNA